MNSETIVVSLCVFLVIAIFLFKSQLFSLLNRLAKFELFHAKNQVYTDQDTTPKLPILPLPVLTNKQLVVRIIIFAIFTCLIYNLPTSLSRILIEFGNSEFSARNEKLGTASYNLALEFNTDLNKAINQCDFENMQKQYELAISYCNKAIEVDKNYSAAYSSRGYAYLNLQQYDQAIADFTKDIELIPIFTRSYINRGNAYFRQGKYNLAIGDLTKSIEINPKEKEAYFNRGLSYTRQSQNDLAFADFTKVIEIAPDTDEAYFYRGLIYAVQGQKDLAIAEYTKTNEINPNFIGSYISRGEAFAETEKFTQAISDYQKALTMSEASKTSSYIYCALGVTYTKMNNFELAITSLEQGVKLDIASEYDWCKSALENARQGNPMP